MLVKLTTVFCLLSLVSCVGSEFKADINRGVDIAKLEPMSSFEVPVRDGFTTVVSLDGDTLAVTRSAISIFVPAYATTRSSQLNVSFSKEDIFGEIGSVAYWHYLSFEDSRNGDYDYNDIVLHCRISSDVPWNYTGTQSCKHTVSVQPVALGGVSVSGLGILYRDEKGALHEQILTTDIRRDLFFGNPTFPINTDLSKPVNKISNHLKPLFTLNTTKDKFPVVWFVIRGEERLYAASTNFDANRTLNMISSDGFPYGLSFTKKWCYPVEKCHISDAYPKFNEWLRTGDESVLFSSVVRGNVFTPATVPSGSNGDLWDWKRE